MEELIVLAVKIDRLRSLQNENNIAFERIRDEIYKLERDISRARTALNTEINVLSMLKDTQQITEAKPRLIECRDNLNNLMKEHMTKQGERNSLIDQADKYRKEYATANDKFTVKLNLLK